MAAVILHILFPVHSIECYIMCQESKEIVDMEKLGMLKLVGCDD